jgi:hypothetical protein
LTQLSLVSSRVSTHWVQWLWAEAGTAGAIAESASATIDAAYTVSIDVNFDKPNIFSPRELHGEFPHLVAEKEQSV